MMETQEPMRCPDMDMEMNNLILKSIRYHDMDVLEQLDMTIYDRMATVEYILRNHIFNAEVRYIIYCIDTCHMNILLREDGFSINCGNVTHEGKYMNRCDIRRFILLFDEEIRKIKPYHFIQTVPFKSSLWMTQDFYDHLFAIKDHIFGQKYILKMK